MARTTSTGRRTAIRAAAGLAPLALALLLQHPVLPGAGSPPPAGSTEPAVCSDQIDDEAACHTQYPTGCSAAGRYDAYLNSLKNRLPRRSDIPLRTLGATDFDELNRKTPEGISKNNHAEFKDQLAQLGEGRAHTVVGYVYYVKKGGKESVNCLLEGEDAIDFHIAIGFDAALAAKVLARQLHQGTLTAEEESALKKTSIIVEMTPFYRAKFRSNWDLDAVKAAIGHQAKASGLLMLDNEHQVANDNCALGDDVDCWRASTWELHPVTGFQVCNADICAEDSNAWVELGEPLDGSGTAPKTAPTK